MQAVIKGFDDDHRVIDQHAEHDDDAEQHGNIQGIAGNVEYPECTRDGERNTKGDISGNAHAQKQPAHAQHEHQTKTGITLHHSERLSRLRRLIVGQDQV